MIFHGLPPFYTQLKFCPDTASLNCIRKDIPSLLGCKMRNPHLCPLPVYGPLCPSHNRLLNIFAKSVLSIWMFSVGRCYGLRPYAAHNVRGHLRCPRLCTQRLFGVLALWRRAAPTARFRPLSKEILKQHPILHKINHIDMDNAIALLDECIRGHHIFLIIIFDSFE